MATQPNPQPLPSYSVAVPTQPQQIVHVTSESASSSNQYLRMIKRTSIIQIVGGVLLVCFGIIAIILLAQWSYFATPIWVGLVFFCLTGCIGLRSVSTGNVCLIGTYIMMSVLGCLAGFVLSEMYYYAAIYEEGYNCQPGYYYQVIHNCAKSEAARQTLDALIAFTGFFTFVLCIVAASFGCCAACNCCKQCCSKCCGCCSLPPPPTTAYYTNGGAAVEVPPNILQEGGALPNYQYQLPNQPLQQQQQPVVYPGNPGQGPAVYPMPPVQEPTEGKTGPFP